MFTSVSFLVSNRLRPHFFNQFFYLSHHVIKLSFILWFWYTFSLMFWMQLIRHNNNNDNDFEMVPPQARKRWLRTTKSRFCVISTSKKTRSLRPSYCHVVEKEIRKHLLIDVAVPGDHNVKEIGMVKKYSDLWIEVGRMWDVQATIVPVINDVLESIPTNLNLKLKKIQNKTEYPNVSKVCIAWLCNILQKVLSVWEWMTW